MGCVDPGMTAIRALPALLLLTVQAACGGPPEPTPEVVAAPTTRDATGPRLSGGRSAVTHTPRRAPEPMSGVEPPPAPPPKQSNGPIEVWVVDAAGRPLAGARVSNPRSSDVTDARGRATLDAPLCNAGSAVRTRYGKTLTVCAPGYAIQILPRAGEPGRVVRVRLASVGHRVAGRLVDSTGAALPAVGVRLRSHGGSRHDVTTDRNGMFVFDHVPAAACRVFALSRRWLSKMESVVPPSDGVRLVAYEKAWIRGRIELPLGEALPEPLRVELEDQPGCWDEALEDGFSIQCRPGAYTLLVNGRPWRTFHLVEGEVIDDVRIPIEDVPPPAPKTPSDAATAAYLFVDLRETSNRTKHIVGFFHDRPPALIGDLSSCGERRLSLPSRRLHEIGIWERSGATWRQPARAGRRIVLRRPDATDVADVVFRLETAGGPVRSGIVRLRWPDDRLVAATGTPTQDGGWAIGSVAAGRYDLVWQLLPLRNAVLLRRGLVVSSSPPRLDLGTLHPPRPRPLVVRVQEPDGRPAEGAVVDVETATETFAARTAPDGRAAFELLDPVSVEVSVRMSDREVVTQRVPAGELPPQVLVVALRRDRSR